MKRTLIFLARELWIVVALAIVASITFYAEEANSQDVKTFIPPRAAQYFPEVVIQADAFMPTLDTKWYFGSLIEHESCLSLTHSKCWNPASQLKTSREEGAGLGQLTRAYTEAGALRFDKLAEMRAQYKQELGELSWDSVYKRPDLQIRTMVIMIRDLYKLYPEVDDERVKLAFSDSGYNGGSGDVRKARTACGLAKGCDPKQWFDNVERYSPKSIKILYGTRSAKDINLHHVHDVLITRLPKYENYYRQTTGRKSQEVLWQEGLEALKKQGGYAWWGLALRPTRGGQ